MAARRAGASSGPSIASDQAGEGTIPEAFIPATEVVGLDATLGQAETGASSPAGDGGGDATAQDAGDATADDGLRVGRKGSEDDDREV